MNKYTLSRRAWPQTTDNLIYCTINGVDMVSLSGSHASVLKPQYAYIDKMHTRNLPSNRATMDFEPSNQQVKVVSDDGEYATLSNGVRLNLDYAAYYLDAYPGAQWYSAGELEPIAIMHRKQLVAVIMPIRSN